MSDSRCVAGLAVIVVSMGMCVGPQTAAGMSDALVEHREEIRALCRQGDTAAVLNRFDAVLRQLAGSKRTIEQRMETVKVTVDTVLASRIRSEERVQSAIRVIALTAICVTRPGFQLMEHRLDFALNKLPRVTADKEDAAETGLQVWAELLDALERHHSAYTNVELEDPHTLARSYDGSSFHWGVAPEAIPDPEFRERYTEWRQQRRDKGQKKLKYYRLMREKQRFLSDLKRVLKDAYGGDADAVRRGKARIHGHIDDPEARAELMDAIQPGDGAAE